jgi:hypothetical protein
VGVKYKSLATAASLTLLLSGCVTGKRHARELDLAFKAGQAEGCGEKVKEWQETSNRWRRMANGLRGTLRVICEKDREHQLVNDVCVSLEK